VTGKTIVHLPNWIGDMVMATPMLLSLRPVLNDELWGIGKSSAIHIFNGLGIFDRFIPFDNKDALSFLDTVSVLKRADFSRGIVMPHSFRSAFLLYASKVRERIGYARNTRGFMLTTRISERGDIEPTVEHYLRISDSLGCNRQAEGPVMAVTDDEEQRFFDAHPDLREPFVVFIVGASYGPSKRWPEANFSDLADLIADHYGFSSYILPGKGEEKAAETIRDLARRPGSVIIKEMGIRDLKVCLSHAAVVVSNDTGPRHIAAALNIPTIVLLGPMDDRYTRYPSSTVCTMSRDVACRPCNRRECKEDHRCLTSITAGDVLREIEKALERKKRRDEKRN